MKQNGKKIIFLVRYFTIGGLERVVITLANEYVEKGYNTKIVVISRGKRNSLITELDKRVEIVFLDGCFWKKTKKIKEIAKEGILHINFGDGKIHPWIRMSLIGARKTITYHSVYKHKRNWFLNKIDYLFNCKIKKVVAVSEAVKDFCINDIGLNEKNVIVIKNGIKVESRKVEKVPGELKLKFLVLCSLYPHKNHKEIIQNFIQLKEEGIDNWHLYFVGDGPCMSQLFLQAREGGIEEKITWYGAVWEKNLIDWIFRKVDILLSASTYEGFPISILEAMRYHIPLMLSNIPPHREVGGESALYFELGNYDSFKERFFEINNNKSILEEKGEELYSRLSQFDINYTVNQYKEIYQQVE